MMERTHKLPELAECLTAHGVLGKASRHWTSWAGLGIEMFSMNQAEMMNEDLELWRKMPGWIAIGQDGDDALLCVSTKSGACALVEIDDLSSKAAQELAPSLAALLSQGGWSK
jgi:hypothetical protein